MIRIAIVDDNVAHSEILYNMLFQYAKEQSISIDVDKFEDGFSFMDTYEKKTYDAVFLDLIMPGMDGMEIAKSIRRTNQIISIIFITSTASSAVMGYKVEALDYMIKPVSYTNLYFAMNKLIKVCERNRMKKSIQIKLEGSIIFVNTEDIIYIESVRHSCIFHTDEGDYTAVISIGALEEELEKYHFARCHKSFIINLARITKMTNKSVQLGKNGLEVPISREKQKALMQKLVLFYGDLL